MKWYCQNFSELDKIWYIRIWNTPPKYKQQLHEDWEIIVEYFSFIWIKNNFMQHVKGSKIWRMRSMKINTNVKCQSKLLFTSSFRRENLTHYNHKNQHEKYSMKVGFLLKKYEKLMLSNLSSMITSKNNSSKQ